MAASLAALAIPAQALDPRRALSQYVYDRWGTDRGFPSGPVYAIAQSNDGYLWIGAQAGLVRFDGWSFHLIREEAGLLHSESVLGLTLDREGTLWIRLQNATMLRYRDGNFERRPPPLETWPGAQITATSRTVDGDLLGAVAERGTVVYRQNRFETLGNASDLPRSPILSLAQTSDRSIWLGTRGAGLYRLHEGRTVAIGKGLPDEKVNCLLPDGGALWAGTDTGMVRWDGGQLTADGVPDSLKRLQILALLKDRDSNVWVGTDAGGLLRLNQGAAVSLDQGEGRAKQAVTALFEDREGNLWIGSDSGIERLRDSTFVTYSRTEGLPTDGDNPLFVDEDNRVWFPPVDGGLWWVRDGLHGHVSVPGLGQDVIYSIAGRKGELWLGRRRGGLTVLHSQGGSMAARTYTRANGLGGDTVYSLYLARDGTVWAGVLGTGVSALREGRFTTYTKSEGLASSTVVAMLETGDGTMWFATPRGLNALSDGKWRTYTAEDGLPSESVHCILEDSVGVLWVGGASGLAFLKGDRFESPGKAPASLREPVLGIAEDAFGSLWVATSNHVLRVNRASLRRDVFADGDVREYSLADGLRGVHGVKRHRSVVADSAGRIWFSLDRGISVVDPSRLNRNAPARPRVEAILTDGNRLRFGSPVHIPGGRRRITFGLAGLSLSAPELARFRYFLEPFDSSWSGPVEKPEAVYTNLSPGVYRLRVAASNPEGFWSDESVFAFEVDPLLWQTWWFRLASVIFVLAAVSTVYRLRLGRLARQLNLRSEERLAERTRIAQELHDTLLQGFLSSSMQVHVAADQIPDDSTAKPILKRSLQLMGQVIEEGRNAVRGLRSTRTTSLDLEQAFGLVPQEIAHAGQLPDYRVVIIGGKRPLRPLLRDEVYRIGREALTNAFRHARARKIEIELKYLSRHFRVVVRDDGRGMDADTLQSGREGHWGLAGMRERADQIGAQLHVWSRIDAGTEVELTVPGYLAFEDAGSFWMPWLGASLRRKRAAPH